MSFTHAAFAVAGLIAAAGPVVIHLLNRRRYRTVEWGAMAFLRKAMQRSRKAVRLRDLLLLALRTAAILLFGLALARPVLSQSGLGAGQLALLAVAAIAAFAGAIGGATARSRSRRFGWAALSLAGVAGLIGLLAGPDRALAAGSASSRHPVHAIFVIDNSRSMAARTLGGTLLEAAKQKATAAVDSLPPGSRVSVLPLCGPERSYTLDAHLHADDARAAIARVAITDRSGSALRMLSLASDAAKRVPDLPTKRVVFLGDQQATGWPRQGVAEAAKSLGGSLDVVQVGESGKAAGAANVWVESFAVQDGLAESGQPATFLATIACAGDAPVSDVEATLAAGGESLASQTFDLRPGQKRQVVLTAPLASAATSGEAAFVPATLSLRVSDPAANRLDRDDVRHLAVPVVTSLPVLFVDQHGPDESLDAGRVGETYRLRRLLAPRPAEGVYEPLVAVRHLTLEELNDEALRDTRLVVIAGVERPTEEAVTLLREYVERGGPLVIAAGAEFDPAAWTDAAWLDGRGVLPAPLAETPVGVRPSQATAAARIEPFRLDAASLDPPLFSIEGEPAEAIAELWRQPFFFQAVVTEVPNETTPNEPAPRILARFAKAGPDGTNLPYLIERRIGRGRVLMLTAGLSSDWDTLTQTNAIVLLDRVTRSLLEGTLPRRGFGAGDTITLPVERRRDVAYTLTPPAGEPRPIPVEPTGGGYAVRIEDISAAGRYLVAARLESDGTAEPVTTDLFAVNGPPAESDLTPLTPDRLAEMTGDADARWIEPDEPLSLAGGTAAGGRGWKWLAAAVLACLLAEMAVASRSRSPESTPPLRGGLSASETRTTMRRNVPEAASSGAAYAEAAR